MEQSKRSQYLQEYLQYKENMSFLNYDPEQAEWTLEKTKGFNNAKYIEMLNGQQEVITWLDSVIAAVQEGAEEWESKCKEAEARCDKYEKALKEIVKRGENIRTVYKMKSKPFYIQVANEALSGEGKEVKP